MADKWNTSMEHWWNYTDLGKPEYLETNLSHCHFVYHKSHMQWPETDSTWASVVTGWWLIAWVMAVSLKMLITVPLCSVIIVCNLTYSHVCSFMVMYHSAHVDHARTDSVLTLYCIVCLKCTSNHTVITSDRWSVFTSGCTDYRSIWRRCYRHRT